MIGLSGIDNKYDLSESLNVTEDFLIQSIEHYKKKYGIYYVGETHLLMFDPISVASF